MRVQWLVVVMKHQAQFSLDCHHAKQYEAESHSKLASILHTRQVSERVRIFIIIVTLLCGAILSLAIGY